jgi:RNA polymerase sigma-70 factor, ECF subfamily
MQIDRTETPMRLATVRDVHSELSDLEIARRVGAGDTDALRNLMRSHNQKLYRTARSILRDDAEAEDAVQEAYLLAYRGIGNYRGDAKLSTWLVRIVINEAIGRLRKRKQTAEIISMEGDIVQEDQAAALADSRDARDRPEQAAMRTETRRLLEKHIDALPASFRTVFLLRAVEEMSVDETAAALDIPPATVRTRLFRARSLLREALAREIDFAVEDAFAFAGERCDRIVAGVLARLAERSDVAGPSGPGAGSSEPTSGA